MLILIYRSFTLLFYGIDWEVFILQELNRRWPFIVSAQEDDRCPGLILVECSSNLTIARLPELESPTHSPLRTVDSVEGVRRIPTDGRSPFRESRFIFPPSGVDERRYSNDTRRSSNDLQTSERRFSTGGPVFLYDSRRTSVDGRRSSEDRRVNADDLGTVNSPLLSQEGRSMAVDNSLRSLWRSRLRSTSSDRETYEGIPQLRRELSDATNNGSVSCDSENISLPPRESSTVSWLNECHSQRSHRVNENSLLTRSNALDESANDTAVHFGVSIDATGSFRRNRNNSESYQDNSNNSSRCNVNSEPAEEEMNSVSALAGGTEAAVNSAVIAETSLASNEEVHDNILQTGCTGSQYYSGIESTRSSENTEQQTSAGQMGVDATPSARPTVSCSRSNPFAHLSTTITGSVPSGVIAGGLAGSLAGLGVLDTSDLNNHVLFYLCGRCVSFDSFDADSVKVHLDLECPGMRSKWARTSELYLALRAAFLVAVVLIAFPYFIINSMWTSLSAIGSDM